MTKFGLKRIPAPKSWDIKKKIIRFTVRPFPGSSSFKEGLALGTIMRDYLGFVGTMREAKHAVNNQEVLVNGRRRKDIHHIVSMMDVVSFPMLEKNYRVLIDMKGKLQLLEISKEESDIIPLKIRGIKNIKKGIEQINLSNGRNILAKKEDYKLGDTLVLSNKDNKIKSHLKLEKGAFIYLISGKHVGSKGIVENVEGNVIVFVKKDKEKVETKKEYAYVLGKDKSIIKLTE